MSRSDRTFEAGYDVYGLIDPKARRETGDDLLSIFYVGKGKDLRWREHEKEVRQKWEKEELLLERRGSKAQRIREILDRGEQVRAIRLSGGYPNSEDAYRAESLAIDLVDSPSASCRASAADQRHARAPRRIHRSRRALHLRRH